MTSQSRHSWDVGTYLVSMVRGDNPWYPIHKCGVIYNEFSEGCHSDPLDNKRYKNTLVRKRLYFVVNLTNTKLLNL